MQKRIHGNVITYSSPTAEEQDIIDSLIQKTKLGSALSEALKKYQGIHVKNLDIDRVEIVSFEVGHRRDAGEFTITFERKAQPLAIKAARNLAFERGLIRLEVVDTTPKQSPAP